MALIDINTIVNKSLERIGSLNLLAYDLALAVDMILYREEAVLDKRATGLKQEKKRAFNNFIRNVEAAHLNFEVINNDFDDAGYDSQLKYANELVRWLMLILNHTKTEESRKKLEEFILALPEDKIFKDSDVEYFGRRG